MAEQKPELELGFDAAVSEEARLDSLILQQEEAIRQEIRTTQDLVSPFTPLDWLVQKYAGNPKVLGKIQSGLLPNFRGLRRVRADGNCFFRAFCAGLLFLAAAADPEDKVPELLEARILKSLDVLEGLGYSRFVVEDFHEALVEELRWISAERPNEDQIAARINDPEVSEAAAMCLRFMCSSELKSHPDEYVHFLPPEYNSLAEFTAKEVDVVYRDADSLHILSLSRAIRVPIKIEYLDRSDGELNHHIFGEDLLLEGQKAVTLLYEPGHYHLLLLQGPAAPESEE